MFKFKILYVFYLVSGASIILSPCLKSILNGDIEMAEILKHLSCWNVSLQHLFYFFFSDFDECANNTDNCDVNAYCNNNLLVPFLSK